MSTPGEGYGQQYPPGQGQPYGEPAYGGSNQPGWGQPATPPTPRNGMGTAALVFGILAVLSILIVWIPFVGLLTVLLALIAVILGAIGRGRVKSMQATNGGAAMTGLVLGVVMLILGVIAQILLIFFAVAFLNFGGGASIQQFQDCLANAGNQPNPAAVQQAADQCAQQFGQQLPGGAAEPGEPE
ncbi:MAG TPA: DUF4190 domain-containing protein [Actinomycetospora sp.]|nr:DUF4190 domain-containing protein [Actinomycetospora sp.]